MRAIGASSWTSLTAISGPPQHARTAGPTRCICLTGVQSHTRPEVQTVALLDVDGKPLRLLLNPQHRHDAVAGETADRAAVPLNHHCRTVDQIGHDLAQPLRAHRRCDVHRMHYVGEEDRDLLVLSRLGGLRESRTALAAELGQSGLTARRRNHGRTPSRSVHRHIPAGVHVGIVSPLLGDVRHIAVPSTTRSLETLVCRLFRDKVGGYPVRIKITNPDHSALVGIGSNSGGLESA